MQEPIAIIGIGCRFPGGAVTPASFWQLLIGGVDAIREVPPERFELGDVFDADRTRRGKLYSRWGGFVDGIDEFDAGFFGFSPREAVRIDPQHRLLLEVAWEGIEDAGLPANRLAGSRTGVFVGISTHDYGDLQVYPANRALIDAHTNTGSAASIAANRLSYIFDFRGPSLAVDTACSSSLVALHLACLSLAQGECTLALAGGTQVVLAPELTIGFCKASMISPDGRCRAFSGEANGYVRGEGAGIVVLKPLARALAEGDPIYAVIRGSAINEDGRTNGMTVPSLSGQRQVLIDAYQRAGVSLSDVHYVEAHGPGTPVGDPIEAEALATVIARERPEGQTLRIGSVKTNIGHLEAASGIAGLIKAALMVKHRCIPPSLHFRTPNPAIPFEAYRLRVTDTIEPWPAGAPIVVGINSFGFGGANAHAVIEAAPERDEIPAGDRAATTSPRPTLLVTSARSSESLRGLARAYRDLCRRADAPRLIDLAAAAALQRAHHEHRLAVVGSDLAAVADHLEASLGGEQRADVQTGRLLHARPPRLAFVFAGMGPQWYGMARELLETEPVFRRVIEDCDRFIQRHGDWALIDELTADESCSRMTDATISHPANFAVQAALIALWSEWGIEPSAVIGHSTGEIAAAYAAGVMDLETSVRVAVHRGRLQQRASGKGLMLAVGQALDAMQPLLAPYAGRVCVAAVNSPASITLSGDGEAITALHATLERQGTFSRVMSVQVPYHSHYMDPIETELLDALTGLRPGPARVPIVSVVTGDWADGEIFDAEYWWRNVRQPVRFRDALDHLIADGFDTFLEIGPHPVLGMSVLECLAHAGKTGVSWPTLRRMESDRATMLRTLASLYTRGAEVRWERALGRPEARVELPLYVWDKERVWLDEAAAAMHQDLLPAGRDTTVLGGRLRTATPHWEVDLSSPALEYLRDHRIYGSIVFPGAGYMASALAAAAHLTGAQTVGLEAAEFRKALFVPEEGPLRLQTRYDPCDRRVEMHTPSSPAAEGQSAWTLHATCRVIEVGREAPATVSPDVFRARCPRAMDRHEFYALMRDRGFTFGPRFMGLDTLFQGDGEALGRVRLPEADAVELNDCRVHPALFDAGLQVLIGASVTREQKRHGRWPAFLPTHAARVISYRPISTSFWSHAVLHRSTPEEFEGSVTLFDDDGHVLLAVDGIRARTLDDIRGAEASSADLLYQTIWVDKPLERARPSADGAGAWFLPADVAARVNAGADRLSTDLGCDGYYRELEPALDRIARAFSTRTLTELGMPLHPGSIFAIDRLPTGADLPEPRQRLLARLAAGLAEAGLLEITGATARVVRDVLPDDPNVLIDDCRRAHSTFAPVLDLLERCGSSLGDILTGQVSAVDVLFSPTGLEILSQFYRDAPSCRLFDMLVGEAVGAVVSAFPVGRELRILEVGAGLGAATRHIMPRLPRERTRYTFTDVSPAFLTLARREWGADGVMRFAVLDLDREPGAQGFEPGSFDLIVGANVVHATRDVAGTVARLRSLLAPGGALVLEEITRRAQWLDVVFGITDGWWAFADVDRRPFHPLLEVADWQRILMEAGFERPAVIRETGDVTPAQSVLVARTPTEAGTAPSGGWLVLADRGGVGEHIAASLRSRHLRLVLAYRGEAFRELREHTYEVASDRPEAMAQLVEAAARDLGRLSGVVHLWSLDMPACEAGLDAAGLLRAQALGYGSMLQLLHALQTGGRTDLQRCALVTGGAQSIGEMRDVPAVAQSPLWGFRRTLVHEHPELHSLIVDCSRRVEADEREALVNEILAGDEEDEVALRGRRRYARRVVRIEADGHETQALLEPAGDRAFRVDVETIGALGSLVRKEFTPRDPSSDEVQIEVKAASLNFRDVMFAMGLLPPSAFANALSAGAMGVDCAGVVTAVGDEVTEFRPGDEVVALAPASLASHTVTKGLVARKPAGLPFADAAALPLAYVTAIYALETIARVRRGERVLIHSATGGVGLAAVAVARRAGAEVYATAGSEAKREYLRGLGVHHLMDSRSLDFANEIAELTGGRGVDIVLNSLAGDAIAKGLSILAPRGRFLEIGKAAIYRNADLPLEAFRRNLSFFAIQIDALYDGGRDALLEALRAAVAGIDDGSLPPLPTQVFSIASLEEALRALAQARHIGKIAIAFDDRDLPIQRQIAADSLFRHDATYLITGGVGGVGLSLARWAVARGARHLVLASRRAAEAEQAEPIEALREQGAEVRLLNCDVALIDDVRRAVRAADRTAAPLKGIFHAAMVIDDAPLGDLDDRRFEAVVAPKAAGAWNLHLATRDRPLDQFVMFSSISSVYGNSLQGNYAAANAFLDGLASYRRAHGLPALTINWGVFSEVGYVARRKDVESFLARQGQYGMAPEDAFAAMETLARRGVAQAAVSRTDWAAWAASNPVMGASSGFRALIGTPPSIDVEGARSAPLLETILAEREERRRRALSDHLQRRVAVILGSRPERVEGTTPLTDMGLDSLMAVELMTVLRRDLAIDLPAVRLLQGLTLDQLADTIVEQLPSLAAEAAC